MIKKQRALILEEADRFLGSDEGKKLIKNAVRQEIRAFINDGDLDYFLRADSKKKFYDRLEKGIMGCLKP